MESLYWIFEAGASFIEGYLFCVFARIFFDKNKANDMMGREILVSCLGVLGVTIVNHIELVSAFSILVTSLVLILGQCFILKRNLLKSCMVFIIYFALLITIDYITILGLGYVSNWELEQILGRGYTRILALVLSKGILTMIVEIVCYVVVDFRKAVRKKNIVLFLALIVMAIMPFMYFTEYTKEGDIGNNAFWGSCAYIAGLILFVKYLLQDVQYQQQEMEYCIQKARNELLESSLSELEESFTMWKTSVHDYKHALMYIAMLVENNRIEELEHYLMLESDKIEQSGHYYKTGNAMLDVIINTKSKVMRKKKISFSVHCDVSEVLLISECDMGILLGNLLDNAIEAAILCREAYIYLTVEVFSDMLEIEVINSYIGKQDLDFITTKPDKTFHGIGIRSVEDIVKKYNGDITKSVQNGEVMIKILFVN